MASLNAPAKPVPIGEASPPLIAGEVKVAEIVATDPHEVLNAITGVPVTRSVE